jgi:hypothetical protein
VPTCAVAWGSALLLFDGVTDEQLETMIAAAPDALGVSEANEAASTAY